MPIRLGQEFGAYACAIGRDIERIKEASAALYEVNMGATAVGTGLNASVEYINAVIEKLRKITGLPLRAPTTWSMQPKMPIPSPPFLPP